MTTVRGPASGGWGILGGTFDPIHYAHLAIADQAREQLGLEGVVFVPAGVPPHKLGAPISDARDRLEMVRLATAEDPGFHVTDVELRRDGPSYTVDTAQILVAEMGVDPWFILSLEALRGLPAWHRPDRLLELVRLAVVPRLGQPPLDPGWIERTFPGREMRVRLLDGPMLGDAARDIRRLAASGRSVRYLVPPAVERYIREHGLYRSVALSSVT